jgi:AraC-like DNA-binding protein
MDFDVFLTDQYNVSVVNCFPPTPGRASWGPRTIPDFECICMLQGTGLYNDIHNNKMTILKNEVLLIPPDIEHTFSIAPDHPAEISCIHFSPHPLPQWKKAIRINCNRDIEIPLSFRRCNKAYQTSSQYRDGLVKLLVAEIITRMASIFTTSSILHLPNILVKAKTYFQMHYKEQISRKTAAQKLQITPEHLNYLFRKFENITPLQFLTAVRIKEAQHLLKTTQMNIGEIALACGYDDPLYFSRVFKKNVGVSPKMYSQL